MNYYADEIDSIEFDNSTLAVNQNNNNTKPVSTIPASMPSSNPNTVVNTNKGNDPKIDPSTTASNPDRKTTTPATKPIQISTKVLADNTSNGWTNTGWVVKKGQRIKISGTGRISLGNGRYATPSGVSSLPDSEKLMKEQPTGGLIAVIGDDNNEFIFVGASKEFIATRDGAMFLGVNEGMLDDNSGSFDVTVEIDPTPAD